MYPPVIIRMACRIPIDFDDLAPSENPYFFGGFPNISQLDSHGHVYVSG